MPLFNKTFFKFAFGFLAIIGVSFLLIHFVSKTESASLEGEYSSSQ